MGDRSTNSQMVLHSVGALARMLARIDVQMAGFIVMTQEDAQRFHDVIAGDMFTRRVLAYDGAGVPFLPHCKVVPLEGVTGHVPDHVSGPVSEPVSGNTSWDG